MLPRCASSARRRGRTSARSTDRARALEPIRQAGGKVVYAWAVEGDADADNIVSNTFRVESPPGSGRWRTYPEADRAAWLALEEAHAKIVAGQRGLLDELTAYLGCP